MISSLTGKLAASGPDFIVVDVGGVGFRVSVPTALAMGASVGENLSVFTSMIVRDDAILLYGFESLDELDLFGLLIGVTGVGPKSALGVLSHLSVQQVSEAVLAEDDAPFRRVSGIGPKTAKLIVLQLTGKISASFAAGPGVAAPARSAQNDLVVALTGLGWSEAVAAEAATEVTRQASAADAGSVSTLLRHALALLGSPGVGSGS